MPKNKETGEKEPPKALINAGRRSRERASMEQGGGKRREEEDRGGERRERRGASKMSGRGGNKET